MMVGLAGEDGLPTGHLFRVMKPKKLQPFMRRTRLRLWLRSIKNLSFSLITFSRIRL